ncbi:hypothetical protein GCM10020331_043640 [Ectobacillus funiculus]
MKAVQTDWKALAQGVVQGYKVTKEEALAIVQAPDEELLDIFKRSFYHSPSLLWQKKVKLNMIINTKSGLCPEDCGYCSQSIVSEAPIDKYAWLTKEKIVEGAQESIRRKAGTYCIVASGRRPTTKEIDHVIEAVKEIRETTDLKICCCLGFF